jgi:hypothetical protein
MAGGERDPLLPKRHGETLSQWRRALIAQAFDLPAWQVVQGFGIPDCSVLTGEINWVVCAANVTVLPAKTEFLPQNKNLPLWLA